MNVVVCNVKGGVGKTTTSVYLSAAAVARGHDPVLLIDASESMRGQRLEAIPGAPPDLGEVPTGCSFAARCKFVRPDCTAGPPELRRTGDSHLVRCVLAEAAA